MDKVENIAVAKGDLFRSIGCWILGIIVAGNVLFEIAGLFLIAAVIATPVMRRLWHWEV